MVMIWDGEKIITKFRETSRYRSYYDLQPINGYFYCPMAAALCVHPPTTEASVYKRHLDYHFRPFQCPFCPVTDIHFNDPTIFWSHLCEKHEFNLPEDQKIRDELILEREAYKESLAEIWQLLYPDSQ